MSLNKLDFYILFFLNYLYSVWPQDSDDRETESPSSSLENISTSMQGSKYILMMIEKTKLISDYILISYISTYKHLKS